MDSRSMRTLILFDIDGTLVRGGPAKVAFHAAMLETFGTAGAIASYDFSGKTDPQIVRELLEAAGLDETVIDAGLAGLWDRYIGELESRISANPMRLLPGVAGLIEALDSEPDVALGLVTGNIVRGARVKLGSVGLAECFEVGGYGSDHEVRERLPTIALERAFEVWGVNFPLESAVIVGDTPRDVQCGKHAGTRTVAVATGRFTREELERTGADTVFDDFSDVASAIEVLML
jgi:phosphoglycolate phosphatase-like HAD superfamily hydrolase